MIPWEATGLDITASGELRLLLRGEVAATARRLDDGGVHVAAEPDTPEWARNLVEEALRERVRLAALVEEGGATTTRTLRPPAPADGRDRGGWGFPTGPSGACSR